MESYFDDSDFICNACQCELGAPEQRVIHYRSEWHRYNVKRRCAELPPIPESLFLEKYNLARKAKIEAEDKEKRVFTCDITKREFKSEGAYNHYINSKQYKKILQKKAEMESAIAANPELANKPPVVRPQMQPIPLLHNLFTSEGPYPDIRALLDDMLMNHGFFLPFVDYLVDIEGLLEYLGYKIGYGHTCILCNKAFRDIPAVQDHMREKGHCMISIHNSKGEEDLDFLEFYEFPHNIDYEATDALEAEMEMEEDEDDLDNDDDDDYIEEDLTLDGEKIELGNVDVAELETTKSEKTRIPKLTRADKMKLRQQQRYRTVQLLGLLTEANIEEDEEGVKSMALTVPRERKRQLEDMNEAGELVLTDGTVIGHRMHKRHYKKKQVDGARTVQSELMAKYFALRMPGYISHDDRKIINKETRSVQQYRMREDFRAGMNYNIILRKHFRTANPM